MREKVYLKSLIDTRTPEMFPPDVSCQNGVNHTEDPLADQHLVPDPMENANTLNTMSPIHLRNSKDRESLKCAAETLKARKVIYKCSLSIYIY